MAKETTYCNKLAFLLTAVVALMLAMAPLQAHASNNLDSTETGSISIKPVNQSTWASISGGTFELYMVAEVGSDAEDGFVPAEGLEAYAGKFKADSSLGDSKLAEELANYVRSHNIPGKKRTASGGSFYWGSLPVGVYLAVQTEAAEGYEAVKPFLVTIPTRDGNGKYVFDVNASPKMLAPLGKTSDTPKKKDSSLPKTGQLWWPVPLLMLAGAVSICLGASMRRRRARA